jgi:hypothetical protein
MKLTDFVADIPEDVWRKGKLESAVRRCSSDAAANGILYLSSKGVILRAQSP